MFLFFFGYYFYRILFFSFSTWHSIVSILCSQYIFLFFFTLYLFRLCNTRSFHNISFDTQLLSLLDTQSLGFNTSCSFGKANTTSLISFLHAHFYLPSMYQHHFLGVLCLTMKKLFSWYTPKKVRVIFNGHFCFFHLGKLFSFYHLKTFLFLLYLFLKCSLEN